jgi:cytochrome b
LPCGLACAGSVVPGLDNVVTAVVSALAALVLLGLAARRGARWARERREDAADAHTAARWRAIHAPHLLTAADRARFGIRLAVTGLDVRVVA